MPDDIFGDIIDAETVEQAVRDTLQDWIVAHLAHQERRRGLDPQTLPVPRSWPTVSEFTLEPHDQFPAIIIVSPGTNTPEHDRGQYRTPWRIEIAVAVAGKDEPEARLLAALYLAAIKGALIQNPTLGGRVEQCRWAGPDEHAFGVYAKAGQRAIYGTTFIVTARDSVNARLGPSDPPPDPYNPGEPLPTPEEAIIDVAALEESA